MFLVDQILNALGIRAFSKDLEKFKSILYEENQRLNLTRVPESDFYIRHLLDSLLLFPFLKFLTSKLKAQNILDFGTGGGFPGVPLALAMPEVCFHLYDKSAKKRQYLFRLIEKLGVENLTVVETPSLLSLIHI